MLTTLINESFLFGKIAALRKLPKNQNLDPDFLLLLEDQEELYPRLSKSWIAGYEEFLNNKSL